MSSLNLYNIPTVEAGRAIKPDGWRFAQLLTSEDCWEKADFRLATGQPVITSLAVKVEVTGRMARRPFGLDGGWWVRVKVTFVGDGDPDVSDSGWMGLDWNEF